MEQGTLLVDSLNNTQLIINDLERIMQGNHPKCRKDGR